MLSKVNGKYILFCLLVILTACGGGGGGGGSSATNDDGDDDQTQTNFIVTATASTGGTISPATSTVGDGDTTTFTVTPNTGFSVNTVSGCSGNLSGTTYTTGAVTQDCSVTASFIEQFTVSTSLENGASISPSSIAVNDGEASDFIISVQDGFVINTVTGCDGTLSAMKYTTGAVTADCVITVSVSPVAQQWGEVIIPIETATDEAFDPQVAVASDGSALAIWRAFDGAGFSLYSSRYELNTGWSSPLLIEANADDISAFSPLLKMDAQGNAIALWSQKGTYANRYLANSGWGQAELIDSGSSVTDLAFDSLGNAMVAVGNETIRYVIGSGWQSPETIAIPEGQFRRPSDAKVSLNDDGSALSVWGLGVTVGTNFQANIYSSLYDPASGWGVPVLIDNRSENANSPQITKDSNGTITAIWSQGRLLSESIYANRYTVAGGWETAERISLSGARSHVIQAQANNDVLAVWIDGITIKTSRYTSQDGWSSPVSISFELQSNDVQLISDAENNALVTWIPSDGVLKSNRYTPTTDWQGAQTINPDNTNRARNQHLSGNADGLGVVIWQQANAQDNFNLRTSRFE